MNERGDWSRAAGAEDDHRTRLRHHLESNLRHHPRLGLPLDGRRHAAVALIVVASQPSGVEAMPGRAGIARREAAQTASESGSGAALHGAGFLLTVRRSNLRSHPGQWALPGGRLDRGESVLTAASREVREELGVTLEPSACLGTMDDYATRSGYVITPLVFWGEGDMEVRPNPEEVESVHWVPFSELCRVDSPRFVSIPESDRPVVQVPIGDDLIHAPTAAVLLQFRRVAVEGVLERVKDYEQPVFAWR